MTSFFYTRIHVYMLALKRDVYTPFRDQIYEKLRNKIILGDWEPGSILTEGELAKTFGVSRTPVREVIRQLESEGLIKVIPKKGILIPQIEEKDVEDIFELREIIYSYAVKKAIDNVTTRDITKLEQIVKAAEKFKRENETGKLVGLSQRFHECILGLAGNKRFLEVDKALRAHFTRYSAKLFDVEERKQIGWSGHREIVAALKKKDKKLACQKMKEHIEQGKKLLLNKRSPISKQG